LRLDSGIAVIYPAAAAEVVGVECEIQHKIRRCGPFVGRRYCQAMLARMARLSNYSVLVIVVVTL